MVLLSRNAAYAVPASVTVTPVTRTVHDIPVEVSSGRQDGMPADGVINLDLPNRHNSRPAQFPAADGRRMLMVCWRLCKVGQERAATPFA